MEGDLIPLADAIKALRVQLKSAIAEGKGEMLKFALGAVELEFNVVVSKEKSRGGKLSFSLFSVGAEGNLGGKFTSNNTQKLKLVLTPRVTTADGALGSDEVAIASKRVPRRDR